MDTRSKVEVDRKAAIKIKAIEACVRLEKELIGERGLTAQLRFLVKVSPMRKPHGNA